MKLPIGFEAVGGAANIKGAGRLDMGLIYSVYPLYWGMTVTKNIVKAPFINRNRSRLQSGQPIRAVAVNSGSANCVTGEQGIWDNEDFVATAAAGLGLRVQEVLTASTGPLGIKLPIEKIRGVMPTLTEGMKQDGDSFAEAILTTDTRTKMIAVNLQGGARVVGIAKGSAMVHPNMGTMLVFLMTDAAISQEAIRDFWPKIVDDTFNQVSIDGDTSPNDMALLMSSYQVYVNEQDVRDAIELVCQKLAQKVARDGQGATKLITTEVFGARNSEEARAAAKGVVSSASVKRALHKNKADWAAVLSALGASGAVPDLANLAISLQSKVVYSGKPTPVDNDALSAELNKDEIVIKIDLAAGKASASAWGCDMSKEYIDLA